MAVCHGVKQGPCYRIATITSPITFFSIFAKLNNYIRFLQELARCELLWPNIDKEEHWVKICSPLIHFN